VCLAGGLTTATLWIMLATRDLEDLVRLRHTLLHAEQLAADLSEWGRHTALVALDGACEYAMRLSLAFRKVPQPKGGFPDLISGLDEELGAAWSPPGRRDVLDMHSARNRAQHGGVLPDPALSPRWRDAVDVFIRSLVHAVYEVDLDDVLLAAAVIDPRLRSDMERVELLLADGDHKGAFGAAVALLGRARSRWRDQQQDAYGWMPVADDSDPLPDMLDAAHRGTDYADVGVFADDLGEYHWLLATRQQAAQGIALTHDDARRAALFVYHWLLRWQHFDAHYPRDRWRAAYAELAPPVTIDGEGRPEPARVMAIDFAQRLELAGRYWRRIDVVVANIPERGRGDWGNDMAGALAGAARNHALTASENAAHGDVLAGPAEPLQGRFSFLIAPSVDGKTVAALLADTIDNASVQYVARQRTAAELNRRLADAADGLTAAFEDDPLALFGSLSVRPSVQRMGEVFFVRVPVNGSYAEVQQAAEIFRGVGGTLAGALLEGNEIVFAASTDRRAQCSEVRTAVGRCTEQVEHLRRLAAANDAADREFAATLEAAVRDRAQ
jgi:hypothetical protein